MIKKHDKVRQFRGMVTELRVVSVRSSAAKGRLVGPGLDVPCAIGRNGITHFKREGDGASPAGVVRVLRGYYRPDRLALRPVSALHLKPLRQADGWSDDPGDAAYNRPVRLPYRHSHEAMWRADGLYDIVLVLDWNIAPRVRGRGSAIFLHVASRALAGTAGCIALERHDLLKLLRRLAPGATIRIG